MHFKRSPAAMHSQTIKATGYCIAINSGLAVYLSNGMQELLELFLEDISIIASLFNYKPRNTQAEVMSPSSFCKRLHGECILIRSASV